MKSLTSLVATSSNVSITDRIGLMSKSEGAPLGGSNSRPLGSWSLNTESFLLPVKLCVRQ